MNIKDLLGDQYKEGMSLEDIMRIDVNDNSAELAKVKAALSKANSEAAGYKNELRKKQTDEEAAAAEREAAQKEKDEAYNKLLQEFTVSKHTARLTGIGMNTTLAEETAQALFSGDTEKVFANIELFKGEFEKTIRADVMRSNPRPDGGAPATVDYKKDIADAAAAGDMVKVAYLTRKMAEEKK